jgi:uncharacterized membrane protein YecN with MAPEG domain
MMPSVLLVWTEIVILVALVVYVGTMVYCARMRARHRIMAPATTGHPEFERAYRIQINTLEQLVAFVPAVWFFSTLVNPLFGAAIGAIWVIGRVIYAISYARSPERRGLGFTIGFIALIVLIVGALVKAITLLPLVA